MSITQTRIERLEKARGQGRHGKCTHCDGGGRWTAVYVPSNSEPAPKQLPKCPGCGQGGTLIIRPATLPYVAHLLGWDPVKGPV